MLKEWGTSSGYEATDGNATESNSSRLLERQAKDESRSDEKEKGENSCLH